MIDIEALVFDKVYTAVSAIYPDIDMSSIPVESPAAFPHVSLYEIGNRNYDEGDTLGQLENYVRLSYQADVYSNKKDTAKSDARAIANAVDAAMVGLGFRRAFSNPIPNIDRSIFRYTLRYEAVVEKGVASGSDTVYRIFSA